MEQTQKPDESQDWKKHLTRKQYVGDGVYLSYDGFHFVLTTENGISVQNEIFLDPQVTDTLIKIIETRKKEIYGNG